MEGVMNCPICNNHVYKIWEHRGGNGTKWFAGRYWCAKCHDFVAISGTESGGTRKVRSWLPACPDHGTARMIRPNGDESFRCLDCDRNFHARNGRLITTRQPGIRMIGAGGEVLFLEEAQA